jgi:hypothetical protein
MRSYRRETPLNRYPFVRVGEYPFLTKQDFASISPRVREVTAQKPEVRMAAGD